MSLLGALAPGNGRATCMEALTHAAFSAGPLVTVGVTPIEASVELPRGGTYLVEVGERDNDALVEVVDTAGQVLAVADHPERRSGTRRALIVLPATAQVIVRIIGKEQSNARGTATVRIVDLASAGGPECIPVWRSLAAADASYAQGQSISSGRVPAAARNARDFYQRAAEDYLSAEHALQASPDTRLRGETELALAGLYMFDLFDWARAEEWAKAAAATLEADDPYRHARAEAVRAYARLQEGHSDEARALLQRLSRLHAQRGESYDAALQLQYISVSYLNQGRYTECIAAAASAVRAFGSLHDAARVAQATQNRALCLWGLGRLAEARDAFERVLGDLDPEAPHGIYLVVIINTALLDLSLGKYDESLRLYDHALGIALRSERPIDAAYCLYGIGANYRALGDPEHARDFLERSLAIRTVALDGRGRMDSLRALAIVAAAQGSLQEAIHYDREALTLAANPLASEGITVQLAAHLAAAGATDEARAQLDEVLGKGPRGDPLILADALVQRALILRTEGQKARALRDLRTAIRRFHAFSSVTQEFAANLELARTLRSEGNANEALAAVERALTLGDAVRVQSVNPDFRVQLQAPLRSAYELKIELLRAQFDAALAAGDVRAAAAAASRAFAAADSSRARSFADVAAEEFSPQLRRELAPELHRREDLFRQLAQRRAALDSLIDPSPTRNTRARQLLSDIGELERRIDTVNTSIATRASRPGHPPGGRRAAIPALPPGSALVSYWLGTESAYAWVLTGNELRWVRLAPPAEIAVRAGEFHDSLRRFVDRSIDQRLANGASLSQLVLAPLEPWLSAAKQWIVVPDGVLDYIPFAALADSPDPRSFAILQHDVALTPAAWMLGSAGSVEADTRRELLLVDDPVYQPDDSRLPPAQQTPPAAPDPGGSPGHPYRRLPYTAVEAAAIRREFPSSEVDELTGLAASRERFLASDLSQYRFIHIAAHGMVDTRVPELSALVLSTDDASGKPVDGAVRVSDFALMTLHAEVAVFSACDTALGKQVASEGLVGIGSTVLARGARAVVASLWPVSDEIGAKLMTEFYRHLLRDSMNAPAALAAAMRSVVSRERATDPALWAAYQVSVVALGPGRPSRNVVSGNSNTTKRGGSL